MRDWIGEKALPLGMVSEEDLELLTITDDVEVIVQTVLDRYEERRADAA